MPDHSISSELTPGRLELPKYEIEQDLEDIQFEPLNNYFGSIVRNAQVKFRDDAEAEAPEDLPYLVHGDSESDEEQFDPQRWMATRRFLSSNSGSGSLGEITVGGAVVENVSLVVPKDRNGGFGDLPVLPITAVGQEKTELVAIVGNDTEAGAATSIPILLMPDEEAYEEESPRVSGGDSMSRLATASVLANLGTSDTKQKAKPQAEQDPKKEAGDGTATDKEVTKDKRKKEEEGKDEKDKVAKTKLDNYVVSGDIKNLFGIKGLRGKLYKFKGKASTGDESKTYTDIRLGPETKEDKDETKDKKENTKEGKEEGKADAEDQPSEVDEGEAERKAQATGKETLDMKADNDNSGSKEDKAGKKDEKGSKDEKDKKEKEKKEPAREKVKINPKSLALLGKPLGTLLPFLESEEIKSLPIENLEFTYCEEKSGAFFPPGLRLEVDVPLTGSLQWATDALQKMFDFALRGYFEDFGCQTWDILQFKALGLELTATKAASRKSRGNKKGKDGKDTEKKNDTGDDESEEQVSHNATKEQPTEEPDRTQSDEPEAEVTTKPASTVQVEPDSTDSQPTQAQQDDAKGESEEVGSSKQDKEEKSASRDKKKDNKDKKDKVKKSYNYGFGFFGTVSFIKVPYAKSPLDLHIRIARDFEVEKEKKEEAGKEEGKDEKKQTKEDEGEEKNEGKEDASKKVEPLEKKDEPSSDTKKASEDTEQIAKDAITADSTADNGGEKALQPTEGDSKPKKAEEKKHSDGRHKRMWNVVIFCDEWKEIYGVKNVSLKKAELKWSFEQGNFKKTMALDLSADIKLGAGSFKVKGKVSKDAELGDVSYSDFKKIHAQIQGKDVPEEKKKEEKEKSAEEIKSESKKKEEEKKDEKEDTQGNEVTFKKIRLKISTQFIEKEQTRVGSLLFEGHVTFNGKASAKALLEINRDGLTISGGLADYQIPDTPVTIEQARMHIFIGFNRNKKQKKIEGSKKNDNKSITDASSDGGKSSQPDQGETTAVITADVDSKPDESDTKDVKKTDGKEKKNRRESEFAVLGVVKIHEVTLSVGLYIARKNDKESRDWLAFGSVEHLTLSQLVPELKDPPLNLQLDNIALIASSEDREIKEEEEEKKEDKKDEKKEKKGDKAEESKAGSKEGKKEDGTIDKTLDMKQIISKPQDKKMGGQKEDKKDETKEQRKGEKKADKKKDEKDIDDSHAGVLKQVESYKYPIRKGVQLCATIRRFDALEQLNDKKPIDGLILIIAFTPEGLEIGIDLPKTLQVKLHDDAILGDFGAKILAAEGALALSATLTLSVDDQEPIRVIGKIKGNVLKASADFYMHPNDKWINPFQLNEKVVVSKLGLGAGITYATVCATGPDNMSIAGRIDVGKDFHAEMVLSLGAKKEQVICVDISEINVSRLVQLAGEMTDIVALQTLNGGEDFLVFRDIKFYMSTGGMVLGIRYDRGIHVRGMMEFFGKKGEFNGRIREDGVAIKGAIDNFNIGGLEVRSARAEGERATMDIEMTGEKQKVLVDGVISFHAFELSILIDAYLQDKRLEADISIKFTEHILLCLKAKASVSDFRSLDGIVMNFEAEIRPDVIGAIFEAINQAIGTLGKMASDKIKEIEEELQRQVDEKESELRKMDEGLQRLKEQVDRQVQKRTHQIDEESRKRKNLEEELKGLEKAVEAAEAEQNKNERDIRNLKAKKEKKEREFDDKIREKELEYQRKEQEERDNQKKWEKEREKLEREKEASFGDALRSKEEADRSWAWWVVNWVVKKQELELEWMHGKKAADAEARHAAEKILSTPLWRTIEKGLNEAAEQIEKHAKALEHIINGEGYKAIQALQKDKRRELQNQIATLKRLEKTSKEIETKLNAARQALKKNKGRITQEEKTLQKEVERLQGELKTRPFEDAYKAKLQEHESVKAQMKNIQKKLSEIRSGIDKATKSAQRYVHVLKQATPAVERILVTGSTDVLAKNKPLTFKIEARWMGKPVHAEVQWAPGWNVAELYDQIGLKVLEAAGEKA
ncbi:hypothetical protein BDV36DRAFT_305117 [Aspergillus pseudocaelatus]|uniref:Uncharacterized protein n=1 Tax=Aspergillus pseudocaelatus TaxID=1825620 RepID=A0ABQ6WVX0_9EURO|nr:hypothetical protein BDV36DRAFT_305117 [Aspergillus pseudocaelatus]